MIKLEHVVLASPEQMKFIIEGCRNPLNSWARSDSKKGGYYIRREYGEPCSWYRIDDPDEDDLNDECVEWVEDDSSYELGPNDHSLMQRLANGGPVHAKYRRMMPVYVRITAPLYW